MSETNSADAVSAARKDVENFANHFLALAVQDAMEYQAGRSEEMRAVKHMFQDGLDALIQAAERRGREQAWGEAQFRYSADYRDLQADLVAALARAEQAEAQARTALKPYVAHRPACRHWDQGMCDCGLQGIVDATQERQRRASEQVCDEQCTAGCRHQLQAERDAALDATQGAAS